MRTQAAIDCRKEMIRRFGMDQHAPYVDVAKRLIDEDRLFVEFKIDSRERALSFMTRYWWMVKRSRSGLGRGVKGLSEEAAQHVR